MTGQLQLFPQPATQVAGSARFRFWLGTHQPGWLRQTEVPLFVSRRRLANRRRLPRALGPWALDSGGFSELSLHGRWTVTPAQYAEEVRRFSEEIGGLEWAAAQDWMCEDEILAKTRLSVPDHQALTVDNYLCLLDLAPDLPWMPVLQGRTLGDYLDHVEAYLRAGIDLVSQPLVGVGSICRRQQTLRAELILRWLADDGLRLHGFGFKTQGLRACADVLFSADSLAWSLNARKNAPLEECGGSHQSCANCLRYALRWRADLLGKLGKGGTR